VFYLHLSSAQRHLCHGWWGDGLLRHCTHKELKGTCELKFFFFSLLSWTVMRVSVGYLLLLIFVSSSFALNIYLFFIGINDSLTTALRPLLWTHSETGPAHTTDPQAHNRALLVCSESLRRRYCTYVKNSPLFKRVCSFRCCYCGFAHCSPGLIILCSVLYCQMWRSDTGIEGCCTSLLRPLASSLCPSLSMSFSRALSSRFFAHH